MSGSLVARRYSLALLQLAEEKGQREEIGAELRRFSKMLADSAELRAVLANPAVRRDERLKLIGVLAEKVELSTTTSNFLKLAIEKGRAGNIDEIAEYYDVLLDEAVGRVRAVVTTTKTLGDDELAALEAKLEAVTGKDIILERKIDPALMGGMITRVGSLVFDGSVRGKLSALRDRLIAEAGQA